MRSDRGRVERFYKNERENIVQVFISTTIHADRIYFSMLNNEISRRCGASELTTFGGGGSALVYFPRNEREFIFAMEEAASDGIAPQILGGGSNVILADGELSTSIVCTRDMRGLRSREI